MRLLRTLLNSGVFMILLLASVTLYLVYSDSIRRDHGIDVRSERAEANHQLPSQPASAHASDPVAEDHSNTLSPTVTNVDQSAVATETTSTVEAASEPMSTTDTDRTENQVTSHVPETATVSTQAQETPASEPTASPVETTEGSMSPSVPMAPAPMAEIPMMPPMAPMSEPAPMAEIPMMPPMAPMSEPAPMAEMPMMPPMAPMSEPAPMAEMPMMPPMAPISEPIPMADMPPMPPMAPMPELTAVDQARAAFFAGDLVAAEQQYRQILAQDNDPDMHGELGNVYYAMQRWDAASSEYAAAVDGLIAQGRFLQAQYVLGFLMPLNPSLGQQLLASLRAAMAPPPQMGN